MTAGMLRGRRYNNQTRRALAGSLICDVCKLLLHATAPQLCFLALIPAPMQSNLARKHDSMCTSGKVVEICRVTGTPYGLHSAWGGCKVRTPLQGWRVQE